MERAKMHDGNEHLRYHNSCMAKTAAKTMAKYPTCACNTSPTRVKILSAVKSRGICGIMLMSKSIPRDTTPFMPKHNLASKLSWSPKAKNSEK